MSGSERWSDVGRGEATGTLDVATTGGAAIRPVVRRRDLVRDLWPERAMGSPIPALDGLRGVAVLFVMVYHAWYFVPGVQGAIAANVSLYPMNYGRTGVQLFFVLSGFLLFLPYARWLFGRQPRPSARLFYKRRALRVGPAYWANLALLVLLSPFSWALAASALAHLVFLHNVFFSPTQKINSVYWTMAVEVQFYAILPAIGWAIHALSRRITRLTPLRAAAVVLGSLTLLSLLCNMLATHPRLDAVPVLSTALLDDYALPYWLSVFAAGMACSVVYTSLTQMRPLGPSRAQQVRSQARWVFAAGLALGLAVMFVPLLHHLPAKDQLFGWVYGAVLVGVLCGPGALRRPFEARILRFVGWISYSLYLWHQVILLALEPHLTAFASVPARTVAGLALDLLVGVPAAYLSFQFTERPFLRARKEAREPERVAAALP